MPPNSAEDNASLVLVMGVTGSGKSYFINKLAGKKVVDEGHDLKSCTFLAIHELTGTDAELKAHNKLYPYQSRLVEKGYS